MGKQHLREKGTIVVSGVASLDNETVDIIKMSGPGLIKHVTFSTDAALGASLGIDLINAGVNGTATTVVQASSDNLNGEEEFAGVDGAVQDGDVLQIKADNYTASRRIGWAVQIQKSGRY